MTVYAVGWRDDDDAFLAFGPDDMPVYGVVGAVRSPDMFTPTQLRWPSCLRMMPYAEPLLDLAEIDDEDAEGLRARIMTRNRAEGEPPDG